MNIDDFSSNRFFPRILGKAVIISDSIGDNFIGCTVITDNRVNGGVSLTVSIVTLLSTLLFSLW